jgi:hypothetical protein
MRLAISINGFIGWDKQWISSGKKTVDTMVLKYDNCPINAFFGCAIERTGRMDFYG